MKVRIVGIAGEQLVAFLHHAVIALPLQPEAEQVGLGSFGWIGRIQDGLWIAGIDREGKFRRGREAGAFPATARPALLAGVTSPG
jgi:hypothetical protein